VVAGAGQMARRGLLFRRFPSAFYALVKTRISRPGLQNES